MIRFLTGVSLALLVTVLAACGAPQPRSEDAPPQTAAQLSAEAREQAGGDASVLEAGPAVSFAVVGRDGDVLSETSRGAANPEGEPLTADTPVRIASVTKTFVAVTALRLWEQGVFDLDAPLETLLDDGTNTLFADDGYDMSAITPRHLLMHISGIAEHADDGYLALVMADPERHWTRADQLTLAVEAHDPLWAPGTAFQYSDTGYVLLGHILERQFDAPLHQLVRREVGFNALGLDDTWWEVFEEPMAGSKPRAHQYIDGLDISGFHASLDLYGGGGLVSTPSDLARFMAALMRGDIFENPETLELMLTAPGQPNHERYRLGLFIDEINGQTVYSHSGFWGVYAGFAPDLEIAFAGVVLDQTDFAALRGLIDEALETSQTVQ